ncbi:MAG: MJ0042-type zinc finger domain-containing protein, partial [Gammaproteobacteria bacterium]
MLTRCPQCETIFRVSKKHISAAKGLVRCGSCKDIFNAKEHVIKSKKDLKRPTAAIKPEAQITKPAKVKEAIVSERKQTVTNDDIALEENSFDFVKDGFISTGAYRKFDSATPTSKPPINKKPTSKAQALDQGKPINFDSVFEDDAPKIPTKDVFITKKPTVNKKP